MPAFELFIGLRYTRAKRRNHFISFISLISMAGIALGVAALLLGGEEAAWSIKKGAVWWLSSRVRQDETQVVLRAVMAPDML